MFTHRVKKFYFKKVFNRKILRRICLKKDIDVKLRQLRFIHEKAVIVYGTAYNVEINYICFSKRIMYKYFFVIYSDGVEFSRLDLHYFK